MENGNCWKMGHFGNGNIVECGKYVKCILWKMKIVENENCGKLRLGRMEIVENGKWRLWKIEIVEKGKLRLWKMENGGCGKWKLWSESSSRTCTCKLQIVN